MRCARRATWPKRCRAPHDVFVAYVSLTDALMMLGRPGESVEVGRRGLEVVRRYGSDATVLISNIIEALIASGEWDDADRLSAAAVRSITANYPYMLLMNRAELELGRGDFASAKAHLDAALPSLREDRGLGIYDVYLAELALWERRWVDADAHVDAALTGASSPHADQLRVWFSAKGLRAVAELAALARARHDADAAVAWLAKADRLVTIARSAAATASSITPNAGGWLALAEAEYDRAHGVGAPDTWSGAASTWDRLERPVLAAYCRWRETEALVAVDAPRTAAAIPLRAAHTVATRIGAEPLRRELELLAQRARLDLAGPEPTPPDETARWADALGLTPREVDVLGLVARGYTNPEIANALFISDKTASVHVSNILRKLDVPNRREAAAVAHRLTTSTPHAPAPPTGLHLRTAPANASRDSIHVDPPGLRDIGRRQPTPAETPRVTAGQGGGSSARSVCRREWYAVLGGPGRHPAVAGSLPRPRRAPRRGARGAGRRGG